MVASMFAPTAGAAAAMGASNGDAIDVGQTDIETDVQLDKANESNEYDAAGSTTEVVGSDDRSTERVDPSLRDASGDTVLLLSVERDLGSPIAAVDEEAAIDTLKRDSTATQGPVIEEINENFPSVSHRNDFWAGNIVVVEADLDAIDPERLAAIDGVERVTPNVEFEGPTPQPGTDGVEPDLDGEFTFGLEQINVPEFEDEFGTQGEGTSVMIGDDGISTPDDPHPDLEFEKKAIAENGEITEGELGTSTVAHGEHVAGTATAAAEPVGDVPRYGVAPDADLLKANVFEGGAFTEDIIASMEWAAENDADAASYSLGIPSEDGLSTFVPEYVDVIDDVTAAGTVAVVSAGNDGGSGNVGGSEGGPVSSPATNFNTVAIGASTESRDIADFSSGAVIDDGSIEGDGELPSTFPNEYVQPDVSAPGADVLSSGPLADDIGDSEATYSFASGTSMAAPHYTGAVALLQSATDEDLDNAVIEAALAETAEKPENDFTELNSRDIRFGTGIIDVYAAAQALDERQTVEGTVTNTAGEPLVGATVETDAGALTATDEDGEFILQTTNDPAEVTADASAAEAQTVTVEDGESVDFVLEGSLDVDLLEGQPATLEAGDEFEVVAAVENLDQLTVELTDDSTTSADDLTLSIGGDEIELGEPIETDGLSGEVAILVEVDEAAVDTEFSLEHTFERFGEDPGETVFEVSDLDAPASAEPGDEIDVSATVTNDGEDAGTQTVEFVFDGDAVADEEVSLDAGESAGVTFEGIPLPDVEGEFEHGVFTDDDSETATIVIEEVDADATVSFDEEEVVFAPDTTKAVPVQTDAADVAGYQATIEFDPSVLRIDSVTTGDVGNGPTTDIDNENGTVGFVDSQADGVDQPDLANVTFEFIGDAGDETDLAITDDGTTVTTADAEDLETVGQEVTWSGGQLGDVNADGEITPADAVLTQQFLAGQDPDGFLEELADVTQTGEVTIGDVLEIEELILSVDADAESAAATGGEPASEDEEIVVVTGPTEVTDEIEGPDIELVEFDQPDSLDIDTDIVSEITIENTGNAPYDGEILQATNLNDVEPVGAIAITDNVEPVQLDPGEEFTTEQNLGSFADINAGTTANFEVGDEVETGFQVGQDLDFTQPPDPEVEFVFSDDVIIGEDPNFEVSDLDAPGEADTGEEIDVSATITNTGGEDGEQDVEFRFEGETVDTETVELGIDESETVEFTDVPLPDEADAYEHGVFTEDDSQTATILVGDVDITTVAVVDDDGEFGDDVVGVLESELPSDYVIDLIESDEYDGQDVAVVQNLAVNDPNDFVDATEGDDVGVVYLDQWGDGSNGIGTLSDVTDDPTETFQADFFPNPITYEIDAEHPILDGIGQPGDSVEIASPNFGEHTWFEGTDADVLAQVAADGGASTAGDALAVDEETNTVLASSLGYIQFAGSEAFTDDADAILANSVVYATPDDDEDETVGFEVVDVDPSGDLEVDPGAELTIDATVENTDNETDTQTVEFVFAGDVLASEEIELDAGEETTIGFNVTAPEEEGEYDWFIATEDDESPTWTLTVSEPGESEFAVDEMSVIPDEAGLDDELLLDSTVENVGGAEGTADSVVELDFPGLPGAIVLSPPDDDEFTTDPLAPNESELLLLDLGTLGAIEDQFDDIDLEPGDEVEVTHVVGQNVNPIEDPEPEVDDTESVTVTIVENDGSAHAADGEPTEADHEVDSDEDTDSVTTMPIAA